jgi:hypothetical protein
VFDDGFARIEMRFTRFGGPNMAHSRFLNQCKGKQ